jgi:octaprenyl-diphosphate synthase
MAFQVVDDALDYQASEADIGKAIGDDFRDGKVTLPVIIAYAKANEVEKQFWQEALESAEPIDSNALQRAKELLVKHDAFSQTIAVAQQFAAIACEALAILPESDVKQALIDAARFAVARSH